MASQTSINRSLWSSLFQGKGWARAHVMLQIHSVTHTLAPGGCPGWPQKSTVGQLSNSTAAVGSLTPGQLGVNCRLRAEHHSSHLAGCHRIPISATFQPRVHFLNPGTCKVTRVNLLLTKRKAYIMTISPRTPSAVQACCLPSVTSLISPLPRLPSQPLLASVRFMPWSYTWALGSWYTLKAMSHSRWKCFTLKQGHTEIMADSGAKDRDKDEAEREWVCVCVCVCVFYACAWLMNEVKQKSQCWVCLSSLMGRHYPSVWVWVCVCVCVLMCI